MNRLATIVIAGLLLISGTGCIGVVSHKGTVHLNHRQAVSHNGELLIVDTKTGEVFELPPTNVEHATVLEVEIEEDDD